MDFLKPLFDEELNGEGDVEILGFIFQRSRILSELEPETYNLAFSDWIAARKENLLERADVILFQYDNSIRFKRLQACFNSGKLMPFVGAGLSIPCGYPGWTNFLFNLCKESHLSKEVLKGLINNGEYEQAAQTIYNDLGLALFNENLEATFMSENEIMGPVCYLPLMFPNSTIITTNFDKVLEQVYKGIEYGFDLVKSGNSLNEILRIISDGSRVLIKLHGDCGQIADRVVLHEEYEKAYNDGAAVEDFFSRVLFGQSLLFLGCSLTEDRTIKAMKNVVNKYGAETLPRHYAFLEDHEAVDRIARKKQLAEANIFPIWYPEGEHEESIEALFLKIMEGES